MSNEATFPPHSNLRSAEDRSEARDKHARACYRDFRACTSNQALQLRVCGSCGSRKLLAETEMIPELDMSQFRSLLTPKPEVLAWSLHPTQMDPLLARFVHHPLTSLNGMCLDLTDFEPHRSNSLIDKRAEAFGYVENDFHDEHSFDRGNESDSFSFDRDDLALQIENHTRELCGLPPLLPAKHTQNAAVPICTHCLTSLRSNRTPKTALACFNVIGDVPHELQNLTLAEKMIIARGRDRF